MAQRLIEINRALPFADPIAAGPTYDEDHEEALRANFWFDMQIQADQRWAARQGSATLYVGNPTTFDARRPTVADLGRFRAVGSVEVR